MASQPSSPDYPIDMPIDDPVPTPTDPIPPTPSDPVVGTDYSAPGAQPLTEGP